MPPSCPRCHAALVPRDEGRLRVNACPVRHGVFLRADETRRVLPLAAQGALDESLAQGRPGGPECPRCRSEMRVLVVMRQGDTVEVDGCPSCRGHWFDEGELDRVRRAPPGSPTSPPTDPPPGTKGLHTCSDVATQNPSHGLLTLLELIAAGVSHL